MAAAPAPIDYFATGQFLHNSIGIENPTPSAIADPRRHRPVARAGQDHRHHRRADARQLHRRRLARRASRSPTIPSRRRASPSPARPLSTAPCSTSASSRARISASCRCRSTPRRSTGSSRASRATPASPTSPIRYGDLMFNGIAPWARRTNLAIGVQGDGSWKAASDHTLRGGFLVQRERATDRSRFAGPSGRRHRHADQRSSRSASPPAPTTSAGSTASTCRTNGASCRPSPSTAACASTSTTASSRRTRSARASTWCGSPTTS